MGSPHTVGEHVVANRIGLLQRVAANQITQRAAASALGLSYRQMKRLVARFRARGAAGLIPSRRAGNRRLPPDYTERVLNLVRDHYADCGPTLAHQQLRQHHGLMIGRETLRTLMRDSGIWVPRAPRRRTAPLPVVRKQRLGELVHIAGCSHRWFGQRAAACTLLMYCDDATGRLQLLRFVEGEATFDYMQAAKSYLRHYGKPIAFYDDKHAAVRIIRRGGTQSARVTQYGRALNQLGIDLLPAAMPATCARIRRTLRTLRGRLTRELRQRDIRSTDAANCWVDSFVEVYNARYAKRPKLPQDAHRPILPNEDLDETFTWRESRTLSSALSLQYDKVLYLIEASPENQSLIGNRVTVIEFPDGRIKIRFEERELVYREFDKQTPAEHAEFGSHKRLGALLKLTTVQRQLASRQAWSFRRNRRYVTRGRQAPGNQKHE
jgi:transposase